MFNATIPQISGSPESSLLEQNFRARLENLYQGLLSANANGSTLQLIDDFCQQVAFTLGEAIKESTADGILDIQKVGWIWGQYRGTALSGERKLQDYYVADRLGNYPLNNYLLEFYWAAYGISASVGEIFNGRILRTAYTDGKATSNGDAPVKWYALRVSLHEGETLEFLEASERDADRGNTDLAYYELRAPKRWAQVLLPEKLFTEIRSDLETLSSGAGGNETTWREQIRELLGRKYQEPLRRTSDLVRSQVFAEPGELSNQTISSARNFLFNDEISTDDAVLAVARAIQMFALYWRWWDSTLGNGDLLILAPVPISDRMRSMPRMGLAFAFTTNESASKEQAENITALLNKTLVQNLQTLAQKWSSGTRAPEPKEWEFLGTECWTHLETEVVKSLDGNESDAHRILKRVLPVFNNLAQLVPSFVHEGHRFGVNLFLGLPYHEQILGTSLARLDTLKARLDFKPDDEDELAITRPIIESCYSLLDSSDIVLFGRLSESDSKTVKWSSLLRLKAGAIRADSSTTLSQAARYEALTNGHSNLFAISAEQSGKLRIISGGNVLLQFRSGEWRKGTGTEILKRKLAAVISKSLGRPQPRLDNKELVEFASLVQRISETPGAGAIFIVASGQKELENLMEISAPPEDLYSKTLGDLLKDPFDTVFRLATMDGATVISVPTNSNAANGELDFSNARLYPRRLIAEKFNLGAFKDKWDWPRWRECLSYGARRVSALALSMQNQADPPRPCSCIVISSDGPIYLMPGEKYDVEAI
jgi:hypothetical protein